MNKHRIGAIVAAAALTLTFAGTAFANDLHQDTPIVGTDFNDPMDCSEGWHFVHTDTDGSDLPSELTATFKDAGTVKVDGYSNGNGNAIVMYDVHVDPSDTLESASDDISNGGLLNLSHVCWTETTTSTTTEETTSSTTEETTSSTTEETTSSTTEETTSSTTEETTSSTTEETTSSTSNETTSTTSNETTPEGSVEELTPPHTDTIGQPTSSSTVSTSLLLVLAGMLSAALVVIPAAARKRR